MEIIKKEKRNNGTFYYLGSLDIKEIIHLIEKDGYVIDRITINFIHDDATFIPPREYHKSSDMLKELQQMETGDINNILYNAKKENLIRQGTIHIHEKVVTCSEFCIGEKLKREEEER